MSLEKDKAFAKSHNIPFPLYYNSVKDLYINLIDLYPPDDSDNAGLATYYITRNRYSSIVLEAANYIDEEGYEEVVVYMLTSPLNKTFNYDSLLKVLSNKDAFYKDILKALLLAPVPGGLIEKYNLIPLIKEHKLEKEYKEYLYKRRGKMTTFRRRRVTQRREA